MKRIIQIVLLLLIAFTGIAQNEPMQASVAVGIGGTPPDGAITNLALSGTNLVATGNGTAFNSTVNLVSLQDGTGTDNQNIANLAFSTNNILTVGIEDGNSQTVNLSPLLDYDNSNSGLTATDLAAAIDELNSKIYINPPPLRVIAQQNDRIFTYTEPLVGEYSVYLNGDKVYEDGSFTAGVAEDFTVSGSVLTFNYDLMSGDSVEIDKD